jgi:hypothetical protein
MVALLSDFGWHKWFIKECSRFPQHLTSSLIVDWEHGPAAKELVKLPIKTKQQIGTQQNKFNRQRVSRLLVGLKVCSHLVLLGTLVLSPCNTIPDMDLVQYLTPAAPTLVMLIKFQLHNWRTDTKEKGSLVHIRIQWWVL